MKKYISIAIVSLFLISCGGDDSEAIAPSNAAPTIPGLVAPVNNKLCIGNSVSFQWSSSTDTNNDPITYQIQIAKDQQFSQIVETATTVTNSIISVLEKGTVYYWRVKATDDQNLSSEYSTVYSFYTSGDAVVNYLPFSPVLVQPIVNSVLNGATATLEWNATDVDVSDKLVFDVYFGTDNPPTAKISENKEAKKLDVAVQSSKEYYWKVVVRDNKGGETIGQIWKFKTN
jgi:hypothetical protein